jgi:hypothetical protein
MSFCPMSWASVGGVVEGVTGGGLAGVGVGCTGTEFGNGDFDGMGDGRGEGVVTGALGAAAVVPG